jgi:pilus assembly protein CpaD
MRWTDDGGAGPIEITAAAAGPAQGTAQAAAEALVGFGVPPGAVRIAAGPPQGAAPQPVRVAFTRLEPVLADCSSRWAEATRTSSNTVMPNFGCAVNSNMAAMAANARDLAHPRGETPASAERRVDVLTRYGKGEPTATKDDGSRVVVSTAVQ